MDILHPRGSFFSLAIIKASRAAAVIVIVIELPGAALAISNSPEIVVASLAIEVLGLNESKFGE
jgi:hypothetical protein